MKIKKVNDEITSSLDKMVKDRKIFHKQRIDLHHGLRKMRFLRLKQRPPKQFAELFGNNTINAPIAFRHVQTVIGGIAKHRPKWNFIMRNPGETDLQAQGERWAGLAWQYMERKAQKPLYWKWVDSVVADSIGVLKFSRHAWEDFPAMNKEEEEAAYYNRVGKFLNTRPECPVKMRVVDPLTVLYPTYEWEPGDPLETGFRSLRDTMRTLRITPVNGNMSALRVVEMGEPYPEYEVPNIPDASVEVSELWTEDSVYVGFLGNWVEIENPYNGIKPYVITGGTPTSSNDPALEFVSTLFPFQRIQPWTDMLITAMVAWAMGATNPMLVTARRAGPGVSGSQETAIEEIPWGKHVDLGIGGEADFKVPPDVGNSVKGAIELMTTMMDRSSLSPAASGFMGTRTAGLAITSAVENSLAMLIPTIDNMQVGLSEAMKMIFRFITDVIKAPVYVSGFEMLESNGYKKSAGILKWGPEECGKVLDVLVDVKRDTTQDEIGKGTHAAFMRDKGLWSEEHAMLYSGVEDTVRERKNILKDMARHHPIVEQYLATMAVSEEPPLALILQQALGQAPMDGNPAAGPASAGGQPWPATGPMGPALQGGSGEGNGNTPGPAPMRGGRPVGSSTALPRGPNQGNPTAGRR